MYFTILFCFSLLLVRFFGAFFGGGLGMLVALCPLLGGGK
jgi:hypothetical protein